MKWLKVITLGLFLVGLLSPLNVSAPSSFERLIPDAQLPTDRQDSLGCLGVISVSYPFYKGLKTWTKIRYKYVKKPLWFDIFGIFGSRYYQVLKSKDIFQYDKAGLMIEWYSYDKAGPDSVFPAGREVKRAFEYKYDDQGRLIAELEYADGILNMKTLIKYDEQGNKIAQIVYGKTSEERFRFTYKHDESGNGFERTIYYRHDNRDKVFAKRRFKFDEQGNTMEEIEYENDGKSVETRTTYKYDDKGKVIQSKRYDADGKTKAWNYKYDRHGNEIGKGYSYKYDQKGNMIERAFHFNTDRRIVSKQAYKYDDRGNLIEETLYGIEREDGKDIVIPKEQTTYEYEFYPEPEEDK